jgi:hypothetical protein
MGSRQSDQSIFGQISSFFYFCFLVCTFSLLLGNILLSPQVMRNYTFSGVEPFAQAIIERVSLLFGQKTSCSF